MIMKKILITLILSISVSLSAYSQQINIAISYLAGEKSKDSHSMEESYAISNSSAAYTVKYKGHRSKNQEDNSKICTFTEQDLKNIKQTIEAKKLNVTDSLFQESSKTKSFEQYCNIVIDMEIDGVRSKIRINGDIKEFDDNDLYNNSVFFITMLRNMIEDCNQ